MPEVPEPEREVLRTNAVSDPPSVLDSVRLREGKHDAGRGLDRAVPHLPLQEVHGGRADEAGDEPVHGRVVDFERRPDLLHLPFVHDDHPVRHGHGFDLVVGDVHRRGLQVLVQLLDLGAHLDAELGVEVGQRFVEEKHLGVAHDGPSHRDPLALAAGKLSRVAFEKLAEIEDARGLRDRRPVHLLPARAAQAQAERHVLVHTVMCGYRA